MKWLTRILAVGVAAVPAIAILLVVAFLGTYLTANVPAPGELKQNQVATIVNKQGDLIAKIMPPEGNRQEVTYDQLAKSGLPDAVKAAEDRDFDSNSGFSPRGFSRAVVGKLTGNSGAGGGSTITQQYVKNAMVGDAATGVAGYYRKFKELAISTKMSSSWSKEDIMSAYLNTIYFGRGAYGAAAAAQAYFGKDIEDLNTSQAALLAGVIRGPSIYDPAVDEAAAESRWNYVLDGMVTIKSLSQSDRDAQKFPRTVKPEPIEDESSKGPEGLIKNQVLAELDKLGIDQKTVQTEGVKITTGIDEQTQNSLENAAKNQLAGQDDDMRTAEVSIDPETGAVRGYFGGWDGMGWDYASTGLQTGSVFKVFALVAALEQDIPLSKQYSSDPYRAKGGLLVTNSDDESCGTCNLATALKMSLNTVYYRLMMDLDHQADDVKDAAQRLGISKTYDGKASLTSEAGNTEGGVVLGQYDSTVLDMASAYATLAAEGIYRQPYFVQKVETATGDVLYDRKPNPGERVVKKAVADNVTAAMEPIGVLERCVAQRSVVRLPPVGGQDRYRAARQDRPEPLRVDGRLHPAALHRGVGRYREGRQAADHRLRRQRLRLGPARADLEVRDGRRPQRGTDRELPGARGDRRSGRCALRAPAGDLQRPEPGLRPQRRLRLPAGPADPDPEHPRPARRWRR